jgi:hypothetical protein
MRRPYRKIIIFAVASMLSIGGCPCMHLEEDHEKLWKFSINLCKRKKHMAFLIILHVVYHYSKGFYLLSK